MHLVRPRHEYSPSRSVCDMWITVEVLKSQNSLWLTSSLKYMKSIPNIGSILPHPCSGQTQQCECLLYTLVKAVSRREVQMAKM